MGYAYAMSPGREREAALSSIKLGFKECSGTLKKIESEFECCIGSIMIEMKGIQGFARICPGDVFEITIKYGEQQKWKTRGKILKDGKQQWDSQQVVFKSLLDDVLSIKAVEVRGLRKNVTLGNKLCETRDLFSAHPQLMTINLNRSGTLKLNLIVTWNPLHGVAAAESTLKSQILSRSSTSLFGSMRSLPALFSGNSLSGRLRSGTLPSSHRSSDVFNHHANSMYFQSQMKKSHSASAGVTIKSNSESSSSGSTSSSLHLTGTSSGFGSASSYSGSASVPCSALTSPDTESAPILLNGRHTTGHLRPTRVFLSASACNLNRADSALLNKRPRPMSQVTEYGIQRFYNQIMQERNGSTASRMFQERSHQDIIESLDENNTDCSSDLTDSSPSKSAVTRRSTDSDLLDWKVYDGFSFFLKAEPESSEPFTCPQTQAESSSRHNCFNEISTIF